MSDDRLKIWIDLGKWFVGTICLVLVAKIIDTGFKDREVGINEIKEYDKYVELVTNFSKVAERRLLAQFFALVTPSEKLREGWANYYTSVNEEYIQTLQKRDFKNKELDSVINQGSTNDNAVGTLITEIERLDLELTPTFNTNDKYESAEMWELLGFNFLINKDLVSAIDAFEKSENSYKSFHQVYEIANFLKIEKSKAKSLDQIDWQNIYHSILERYSWKIPEDIKARIKKIV